MRCYSKTESSDIRVSSAVLTKNEGDGGLLTVKKYLGLSSETYSSKYFSKADKLKKNQKV